MFGRRLIPSRLLALTIALIGSCTERRIPEERDLEAMCEDWCSLVFSCPGNVSRDYYVDVEQCLMDCVDPESAKAQRDSCGTAHWNLMVCLASLNCEELLLNQRTGHSDPNHPCQEEELALYKGCP